jgi:hypothetical protein
VADVTDQESPLWDDLAIDIVPTVLIFEDGIVTHRLDGTADVGLSGAQFLEFIKDLRRAAPA